MQPAQIHKDGLQQYLFFPLKKEPEEGYVNQLFQYHEIPGFLNYEIRNLNEQFYIYYRLKYRTSIDFLKNHISFQERIVDGMIRSIEDIIKICKEYLLSIDNIIWSTEYIFIDMETGKLQFCYSPVELPDNNICAFLSEIMQIVGKKNQEAMVTLLQLYDYVTEPESCEKNISKPGQNSEIIKNVSLEDRENDQHYHMEQENTKDAEQKTVPDNRKGLLFYCSVGFLFVLVVVFVMLFYFDVLGSQYYPIMIIPFILLFGLVIMKAPEKKQEDSGSLQDYFESEERETTQNGKIVHENATPILYGETTVLGKEPEDYCEIVVEDSPEELCLYPRQQEMYPIMEVSNHSIIIGCMKENCDYVLSKRGISRIHAKVIKVENLLYLLDLNSTNGTFLNGERLECGKDYLLKKGDIVAFSQIEFVVEEKGVPLLSSG